ncbi:DNA topoisomerase 2-associated protein pat1 like [Verticillium longisporum]|nr:DNA topoisomerase 2-associated protein pat1 like [Verticillium longisporum]
MASGVENRAAEYHRPLILLVCYFTPPLERHHTESHHAHDPFAGLSHRTGDNDDAMDFEDTYDGLGDQLDESGDAFNDDTFGGGLEDSDCQGVRCH